jgi:hypothetical protein
MDTIDLLMIIKKHRSKFEKATKSEKWDTFLTECEMKTDVFYTEQHS